MTKKEFLEMKIKETRVSIDDALKQVPSLKNPRVRTNYDKFLILAQSKLERYLRGELNESEEYALTIEKE